jgi:hypothetical protein
MGHYFGIASRLKVKKDAPSELFDFLDYLYSWANFKGYKLRTGDPKRVAVEDMFENIARVLTGQPGYMPTWNWRVKEEKTDHWLYESRSAANRFNKEDFVVFLRSIQQYLILQEGDILMRYIYEEEVTETIIFFNGTTFEAGNGYTYKTDHGTLCDWTHPQQAGHDIPVEERGKKVTVRPDDEDELFWTRKEIEDDLVTKQRRRDRELKVARGRGQIGFGYH